MARDSAQLDTPADAGFVERRNGRVVFRDPERSARWTAELLPDGRLRFKDHLLFPPPVPPSQTPIAGLRPGNGPSGGSMPSLHALILSAQGMNFWIQRKKRLVEATRAMRERQAIEFARANVVRQQARLGRELANAWASPRPAPARRSLLFDLWDQCDEPVGRGPKGMADGGLSAVDAMRRRAATQARARVVQFVQHHLPERSAQAYSAGELRALNARRLSHERFDPYREG